MMKFLVKPAPLPTLEKKLPVYTLGEVENHCSLGDCWIVIYDYIYDVTKFIHSVSHTEVKYSQFI